MTGAVALQAPVPLPVRRGLLVLGVAWGLGAEWTRFTGGWSAAWIAFDFVPGIVFLIAAQIAWDRRPDTLVGPLMTAVAFAWYVGTYGASTDERLGVFAHAFQGYFLALLAWLVLAYPTGRLPHRAARAVVGAWFVMLAARSVFRLAISRRSTDYDLTQASEVDRYVRDITLRDNGDAVFAVLMAGLAVVVLVLIVRRLMTENGIARRVAAPILAGGLALAIGVVIQVGARATTNSFADRAFVWDLAQGLNIMAITVVSLGFAYGVARSRLARGTVADLVVELGEGPDRPLLRDVLARALHDPSLEVAYSVPGTGTVRRRIGPGRRVAGAGGFSQGDDPTRRRRQRPSPCSSTTPQSRINPSLSVPWPRPPASPSRTSG